MTAATLSYARSTGRPRRLALDPWEIGPVAALLLVGLVMVASASIQSLGGQARYPSPSPRRDDSSTSRPQASRSEPRTPRVESSSRPSRGDSGARSSGARSSGDGQRSSGQHSGGGQRSAPRPPRDR